MEDLSSGLGDRGRYPTNHSANIHIMQSKLIVQSDDLDPAEIARHLELKGLISNECWQFASAERLDSRDGNAHAQYWITLLDRHKDGKNQLIKLGYRFTIEFVGSMTELNVDAMQGLSVQRVSIRLQDNPQ